MQNNQNTSDDAKLVITPREQINNNFIIPVTPNQLVILNEEPPNIKIERKEATEKAKQARLRINY